MDLQTKENVELLEKLGYFYEESSNSFWSSEHELYVNLPIMHCNDNVRVMNAVIKFEKDLSYNSGFFDAQSKMRKSIGL